MKTCIQCGQRIIGRMDKIYCDQHCRNDYHNYQRNKEKRKEFLQLQSLRKNKRILDSLFANMNGNPFSIKKIELEMRNFDWNAFTNTFLKDENQIFRCLGYDLVLKSDAVHISLSKEIIEY